MAKAITVPRLGWSMEEGTFAGWLVREGQRVRRGELLYTLEGDKAAQEVESLDEGILRLLPDGPQPGATVKVGQVLGYLVEPSEFEGTPGGPEPPIEDAPTGRSPSAEEVPDRPAVDAGGAGGSPEPSGQGPARAAGTRPRATPRARRRAAERGIDWTALAGSGRRGRVRERDVLAAVAVDAAADARPELSPAVRPHSPLRRTIAARLVASHQATAPVTLTTTADATNLVNLRAQLRQSAPSAEAVVPGYNEILMKLAALALRAHPTLNARWEDAGLALVPHVHIGLAVDTEAGLLVPVVRDVDRLALRALAAETRRLVEQARRGALPADAQRDGTFTVTNLGAYGIDAFTPIINPPQCAILGVGRIRRVAVVEGEGNGDRVLSRDQVTFSLTFDHRAIDGGPAARFLRDFVRMVESPAGHLIT